MGGSINANDKVKNEYHVYISTKDEEYDMNSTINEFIRNYNYEEISRLNDLDNVIVIIRKKANG